MNRRRRAILVALVVALALLGVGVRWWLSSQPRLPLREEPGDGIRFVWSGALTATGARVTTKIDRDSRPVLIVSERRDLRDAQRVEAREGGAPHVWTFELRDLLPDTAYSYAVEVDGHVDRGRVGRLRTLAEGPFSFAVAVSSCARTGSSAPVFDTIRRHAPRLFLHLGDFHYEDIAAADAGLYRDAYDRVLASPAQAALYREVPVVYVWDDHDFGPNNAHGGHPGGSIARRLYRAYVPHHPLAAGDGDEPIHHAFTVGRVRFVVTDLRSRRTPQEAPDDGAKTMLGERQKRWLEAELERANGSYPLIVWMNSVPWIAPAEPGEDHWGGYATERRELANHFARIGLRGLAIVSGDAHMLAIDDGTHADYADGGGPRIPVLQAGALDSVPAAKGGPYTEGAFPGGGQFALMRVDDTGTGPVRVTWSGRDWTDRELIHFEFESPPPP